MVFITAHECQAEAILSAVFSTPDCDGHIGIWDLYTKRNQWFPATSDGILEAAKYAKSLKRDVYFHCCTHDQGKAWEIAKDRAKEKRRGIPAEDSGMYRGARDSAASLVCLWADIDIAEAEKDNGKHYPPGGLTLQALRNLPLPPSAIVHSGRGFHAYWFLIQAADAQEYRDVPAQWQQYLSTQVVDRDTGEVFEFDAVGDLARVLRVPGTINTKAPRADNLVRIIELHPERRYSLGDFLPYLITETKQTAEYTDKVDFKDIHIELDQDARVPPEKLAGLMGNAKFHNIWTGKVVYTSPSEADLALAGFAARAWWRDQEIADLMIGYRRERGFELHLHNAQKYARTIAKARGSVAGRGSDGSDREALIDEMNARHAIIRVGGKVLIMNEEIDPNRGCPTITLSDSKDFKLLYSNRTVLGSNGKPMRIGDYWLSHPRRRQYQGLVFLPGGNKAEGYYNLFRGFAISPKLGDCSRFKAHIRNVICSGNDEVCEYFMNWCAHLFQRPEELPEVAIVLRGGQGTGKNTCVDTLVKLVGRHYIALRTGAKIILPSQGIL